MNKNSNSHRRFRSRTEIIFFIAYYFSIVEKFISITFRDRWPMFVFIAISRRNVSNNAIKNFVNLFQIFYVILRNSLMTGTTCFNPLYLRRAVITGYIGLLPPTKTSWTDTASNMGGRRPDNLSQTPWQLTSISYSEISPLNRRLVI